MTPVPVMSSCRGCGRWMVHSRTHANGTLHHEARGLCTDCYGNKKNRARLVSVMTAEKPVRDCVEVDVCRRSKLTYRQLDYAVRQGWLTADSGNTPGSGYERLYTSAELAIACMARALMVAGFRTPDAFRLARRIHDADEPFPIAEGLLTASSLKAVPA